MENIMKKYLFLCAIIFSWGLSSIAQAFTPEVKRVKENVYALVGEIGQRNADNQGLNNTSGFIITSAGVVLIGSGATEVSARMLEQAVKTVTTKPIVQVITIGVQDHHWMGNGYFLKQNIPVLALQRTVQSQQKMTPANQERLAQALGGQPTDYSAQVANQVIQQDEYSVSVGDTKLVLRYLGDGHFPGDAVLLLPEQNIIFSGDIVFNDRMLGVLPDISQVKTWLTTFQHLVELKPDSIVPGHGYPSDIATAQKNTGDYLNWLISSVSKALEDMQDLTEAVKQLSADQRFAYLKLADELHARNIHQTYLQLEAN